jgi:hypothetical protein
MFNSPELKAYLETQQTISNQSLVIAEWNLNIAEKIDVLGNYRYRPNSSKPEDANYLSIKASFIRESESDQIKYYLGATDADVAVDGGPDENGDPIIFLEKYNRNKGLFSLEDCLGRFRPRSGINKAMFFDNNGAAAGASSFFSPVDEYMHERPRYYIPSRDDRFKYWSSYRQEVNPADKKNPFVRGRSEKPAVSGKFYIDDTAPFVIYREAIPTNKIVVKIQTNTGVGKGFAETFVNKLTEKNNVPDPFYADASNRANMTVPKEWKVQGLYGTIWQTLKSNDVTNTDLVLDETAVGNDGYLELLYGLIVPEAFKDNFRIAETYTTTDPLPEQSITGYAYLVKSGNERGIFYVYNGGVSETKLDNYDSFVPSYSWRVGNQDITAQNQYVVDLTSPDSFVSGASTVYREFQYIDGIRIVVTAMNKKYSTFDLIEMSPRLSVDLSDRVKEFELNKIASDIGYSGLPVGQLLVSNGSISIFDFDQAFNSNNTSSIISKFASKNLQIKFYDIVTDVPVDGENYNFYIPIKTMYSDGFQDSSSSDRMLSVDLRDQYFYFESLIAPQILLEDVSLSMAISILLDGVGFSNYTFKRKADTPDIIIPYFFIAPNTSVAEVLNNIAVSTQSAMFFDEYNNFVVMTREHMLDNERLVDTTLIGDKSDGTEENPELANILEISNKNSEIYNDGKIVYSTRYIQKTVSSLNQASLLDEERSYGYQPVLLWEVSPSESTKSQNDLTSSQSAYALTAIPLNSSLLPVEVDSTLSALLGVEVGTKYYFPYVQHNQVKNNVMDFGSSIYWIPRYNGYFYANGEIIKFDAVQYNTQNRTYSGVAELVPPVSPAETSNKITLSSTSTIKIGDTVQKVSGFGEIGPNARVSKILSSTQIEVNVNHETTPGGEILLSITSDSNVWISSLEEYQNYFSKIPFGGKLYPTGKVRIYSEPKYDSSGQLLSGVVSKHGRGQLETTPVPHTAGIDAYWTNSNYHRTVWMNSNLLFKSSTIPATVIGRAGRAGLGGEDSPLPRVRGIISNSLSSNPTQEDSQGYFREDANNPKGSIKSSALTIKGPYFSASNETPINYISYVYKDVSEIGRKRIKPTAFGARMRIVGRIESGNQKQSADGSSTYYNRKTFVYNPLTGKNEEQNVNVGGGSGGISILLDKDTNNGYYFEIIAISDTSIVFSENDDPINNVLFYKIKRSAANGTTDESQAIPELLWSGIAPISVDNGKFSGQSRVLAEENPSVYDLAIEYSSSANGNTKVFDLYINGNIIATVTDKEALPDSSDKTTQYVEDPNQTHLSPQPKHMAMFVRGSSNVMFENAYAISKSPTYMPSFSVEDIDTGNKDNLRDTLPSGEVLDGRARNLMKQSGASTDIANNAQFNRYTIPGPLKNTLIPSISPANGPEHEVWFEEFGTIMREAAYFNVKYEKAYPALYSMISPTFNSMCGYSVSGFVSNPYGAEFMVFNNTDTILNLDSTSGNYLRIQGIAFTQESQHDLTVDEFYKDKGSLSDMEYESGSLINPQYNKSYVDIKNSRTTYGKKAFSIEPLYVQSQDAADSLMKWMIELVRSPRKSVGVKIFSNPMIQLGDIVDIQFQSEGFPEVSESTFVVYHITYSRSSDGPEMTIYLSEVV